jgi:hypothetical protein
MGAESERAFSALRINERQRKPRTRGLTEFRGPYVDHSLIVQLECLRSGIWGTSELWGRVHTYQPHEEER